MKKDKTKVIDPEVGNYIHKRRKEIHMTQEELAHKVGVSHTQMSRLENAERSLRDVSLMKAFAEALDVSVWEIIKRAVPELFENERELVVKNPFPQIESKTQEKSLVEIANMIVYAGLNDEEVKFLIKVVELYIESRSVC